MSAPFQRAALGACVALLVLVSGCRKKTAPEFYKYESNYSIITMRDGDDAYSSDDMAAIVTGLTAIPADAEEGPKAAALLAKINGEKQRLAAEAAAAEREKQAEAANAPTRSDLSDPVQTVPPPSVADAPDAGAAVDAGLPRPRIGMLVSEFRTAYSRCVSEIPAREMPGVVAAAGPVRMFEVNDARDCRWLGLTQGNTHHLFVFQSDKLKLEADMLTQPPPTPKPVEDAGSPEPVQYFPGAPRPQ